MRKNKPIFGGLVETHVLLPKSDAILNSILPGWSFHSNYDHSDIGRIWVVWHPSVQVKIISSSRQMTTCLVKLPNVRNEIAISCVYGSNCRIERRTLWQELEACSSLPQLVNVPWLTYGDFNEILDPSEHSKIDQFSFPRGMRDFKECIDECSLFDLPYCGNSFTWSNGHVSKKLDRILTNSAWLQQFPESIGVFGVPGISDHSPCCVFLDQHRPKQKRPFKFFAHLNQHEDFVEILGNCWNSLDFHGTNQLRVSKKLKELKGVIKSFSREHFSHLEQRVEEAFTDLCLAQANSLDNPSPTATNLERDAHHRWHVLAKAEDSFLKQRSRVQWSVDGDSNTAYYHGIIKSRQAQNQIVFLLGRDGTIIDRIEDIKEHAVDYYTLLLGGPTSSAAPSPSVIASFLPLRCSPEAVSLLDAGFSDLDIQTAFFALPKSKAPGPDGYPAEFFIANWSVVGTDMIAAIKEFLTTGCLLQQWNSTIISLIPKKPNANQMTEFRPISCCNTVYKVASKLLANRIKAALPKLISSSQSAFVPGRLLVENVLLATELVSGYKWKDISKRCMLKVDLQKAFDSINWDFILNTLEALGFPSHFRKLISQCISTTRFSVSVNGELCGYFKGTKGLRQGDPLSPYLFVIALEVFSQMLNAKFRVGDIGYHPNTSEIEATHLAFADDIMIFFDGEKSSLENIVDTMELFATWSGLRMNKDKTELFVGGLNQAETTDLTSLGFNLGSMPVRYLGLPLMHRKLQISNYRPLLQKIKGHFTAWSTKKLSYAGRAQLISSVIYGTINFWTSAFVLPKGCIKQIQSLCSCFLWTGNITRKGVAKIAWSTVCLPKKEGGLGLRDFETWNKTLCLKLIWMLYTPNPSLWASWIRKYKIGDESFWSLEAKKAGSWTWRSLLNLRPIASNFLKANLGNGQKISFWWDIWTPLGRLIELFGDSGPRELCIPLYASVADTCDENGWRLRGARSLAAESLQIYLTGIILPSLSQDDDVFHWVIDGDAMPRYSASRTWEELRNRAPLVSWSTSVWFKMATPRHAFLMWIAHNDRMPTRVRLSSWGLGTSTSCCLCDSALETRDHLLLGCEISEQIWKLVLQRLGCTHSAFMTWTSFVEWISLKDSTTPLILKKLVAHATIYNIWAERNKRLHQGISSTPPTIYKLIDRNIRDTILGKKKIKKSFKTLMLSWLRNV
ncbi:uncharacterized protein LOC117127540 [Brassica rapa]|uniref:uncharacterized protein LOC117127540 n=1 Tax=Brassica campestris TaxID=3711 RepID=UPI00142D40E0|nr:uncharacterized protein LOC117127540 [Brassica rapa]